LNSFPTGLLICEIIIASNRITIACGIPRSVQRILSEVIFWGSTFDIRKYKKLVENSKNAKTIVETDVTKKLLIIETLAFLTI